MPLESATFVADLVSANPVGATDPKSDGDNHIRMLKQVLQNSFPGLNRALNLKAVGGAMEYKAANFNITSADAGEVFGCGPGVTTITTDPGVTLGVGFGVRIFNFSGGDVIFDPSGVEVVNSEGLLPLTYTIANGEGALFLSDGGFSWWVQSTGVRSNRRQIFTQTQVFRSVDGSSSETEAIALERLSPTPQAGDGLLNIQWFGNNSALNPTVAGRLAFYWLDVTAGGEDSVFYVNSVAAGSDHPVAGFGQGLYYPSLTDFGSGFLNWLQLYINNDRVLPISAVAQLSAPNIEINDKLLGYDNSLGSHRHVLALEAGTRYRVWSGTFSGPTLDLDIRVPLRTHFQVKLYKVVPTSDNQDFWLRVAHDTVPTFVSAAASYGWRISAQSAAGVTGPGSESDTKIQLNGSDALGNQANEAGYFTIDFYAPGLSTDFVSLNWVGGARTASSARNEIVNGFGSRLVADDVTFIRFLMSGGGAFSCNYEVYAEF